MIAQDGAFTDQKRDDDMAFLHKNHIRTVANLRVLSPARIEGMNLSDLAKEYLLRVHSGRRQSACTAGDIVLNLKRICSDRNTYIQLIQILHTPRDIE